VRAVIGGRLAVIRAELHPTGSFQNARRRGFDPLPTSAPKRSGHRTCSYGAGGDRVRLALTSISPAGGYVEGSMQQLVDIGMGPAGDVWVT